MQDNDSFFENKTVLITGGAGSIGSVLVKKVLTLHPKTVRILDINETELFNLGNSLSSKRTRLLVGDVRDKDRLVRAVEDVDIVFHAAALKHVPLCEYNPFEAVQTNVLGTKNLIEAAIQEEVEKVITISTDKAVNPVNVMGASKLLAERLTVSANLYEGGRKTVFACVRFGNVLNSRGSVIPIFKEQIQKGGPVEITAPDMTRFVMQKEHAVDLVLTSAQRASGGEIYVLKMPALKISDLAQAMIEEYTEKNGGDPGSYKIKEIGIRPGEKIFEELISSSEAKRAVEEKSVFIIKASGTDEVTEISDASYCSNKTELLNVKQIKNMLDNIL